MGKADFVEEGTRIEDYVERVIRNSNNTISKPSFRILYAVWDCEKAYRKADELIQRTKDRFNLRFDVIDLSKEERIEKLREDMLSGHIAIPRDRYNFVVINLGDYYQAGWAYFFADTCNIWLGMPTLIAESSNGTDIRDEARLYCKEFVTSLTAEQEGESFEALLRNGS